MPLSNLTAYTSIPENSAATPGLFDSRFNTLHGNVTQVNNDLSLVSASVSIVSISLSQLSTTVSTISGGSGISGYRDVTVAKFGGAIGDGTTDDRAAFNTGSSSVATQAVLYAPSAASVYRIASAVTIAGTYAPIRGAILRPVSGVTVYLSGEIAKGTGSYQIFDRSLGGSFSFLSQREFNAAWFGVVGDGVTDDSAAMNTISLLPDFSHVYFDRRMDVALYSTWTVDSKLGMHFRSCLPAKPDGFGVNVVWRGAYGGTMIAFNRSGHCKLLSVGIKMTDNCYFGAGASIAASQTTLSFNGFQQAIGTWVGRWALVVGAGPGGADLITTVASFQSVGQITLSASASSSVSVARYIIGSTATSGPPAVGLDIDMVPSSGAITTECEASDNLVSGIIHNQTGYRVANSSVNNCEFMTFSRNRILGAWTSPSWLMPLANTHSVSVTTASSSSNVITGTLAGFFVQNFIGLRLRASSAGNASGTSALDGYITAVHPSGFSCTIDRSASTTLSGLRCLVSEGVGTGLAIGDHSNAMRHQVEENDFGFLNYGVDHENGSMSFNFNHGTANEVDFYLKSNSNPLVMVMNQSEQARQHLAGPTTSGNCAPIVMLGPRLGTGVCGLNKGFIAYGPGTKAVETIGVEFDDPISADATYWDLSQCDGTVENRKTMYTISSGAQTMARAGYNTLNSGLAFTSSGEVFLSDAPAQTSWMKVGSGLDDQRFHALQVSGRQAFHAPATAPTDSKLTIDTFAAYNDSSGLAFRTMSHSGTAQTFRASIRGVVDLVDGATVTTDASAGDYFALQAAGAARTLSNPTNPSQGQRITYQIWNNSGGVLTITWDGAFKFAGWVDPANGKVRTITFVYYSSFGQWIQDGTVSPDL